VTAPTEEEEKVLNISHKIKLVCQSEWLTTSQQVSGSLKRQSILD
jgi:hypothetical protein